MPTTRTNLVSNPSFEVNTTGWSAAAAALTVDSTAFFSGTKSAKLVANGTGRARLQTPFNAALSIPVSASTAYTISGYFKVPTLLSQDYNALYVEYYSSTWTYVGEVGGPTLRAVTDWNRQSLSLTTPAGTAFVVVYALLAAASTTNATDTIYVDAVMVEQSSTVGTYFDGATTDTPNTNYSWTGTAHASTSTAVILDPVSKNVATSWNVAARTTQSTATTWGVAGRVTNTLASTWDTRARITQILATTWATRTGVGNTCATAWNVRQPVTKSLATSWGVLEAPFNLYENFIIEVETSPGTWLAITGESCNLGIARNDSNPGTLNVEVIDADLDPVTSTSLSMGKAIRVKVDNGPGWSTIYTGRLADDVQVTLDPLAPTGKQVSIQVSAVDAVEKLANTPEARGVQTVNELRWLVGTTVPYVINGSSAALGSGTIVARNENASLWDQILVTRDTNLGYAWVDGDGALRVYDEASMDTSLKASLTPSVYRSLNRDFTSTQVINQVHVNWRRYNIGTETSVDVPYGPYSDGASVAQWGPRSATFTIQGPAVDEDEATMSAFAADVLARSATAQHRPKSMTIMVDKPTTLAIIGDLDLNSYVSVTYEDGSTVQTMRITSIAHNVSVQNSRIRWETTLEFATTDGIVRPSQTPGTGNAYVPPGSITEGELDPGVTDSITNAATMAADALADAADAFNLASTTATTVNGWTYTGTTQIDGGDIRTDTIGAVQISANAITSKHTLTGPLIQTTATANRGVKINSSGLFAWDASGVATFNIDASTGSVTMKGDLLSGSNITGATVRGSTVTTSLTGTGARIELNSSLNTLDVYNSSNVRKGRLDWTVHAFYGDTLQLTGPSTFNMMYLGSSKTTFTGDMQVEGMLTAGLTGAVYNIESDTHTITGISVNNTVYSKTVAFTKTFASAPAVICTATAAGQPGNWSAVTVTSVSTSGFTANVVRLAGSGTSLDFNWIATTQ